VRAWLRKFINLSPSDRALLAAAAIALVRGRIFLTLVPIRQILRPVAPRAAALSQYTSAQKIGWAVETAARRVPTGGNCLVRAIAGRTMLARYGFSSQIRLGVRKNGPTKLDGHAWLECDGKIITGEDVHLDYADIPINRRADDNARIETGI
jgi:hypothetical protein